MGIQKIASINCQLSTPKVLSVPRLHQQLQDLGLPLHVFGCVRSAWIMIFGVAPQPKGQQADLHLDPTLTLKILPYPSKADQQEVREPRDHASHLPKKRQQHIETSAVKQHQRRGYSGFLFDAVGYAKALEVLRNTSIHPPLQQGSGSD